MTDEAAALGEALAAALVAQTSRSLALCDAAGTLRWANEAFVERRGALREALVGQSLIECLASSDADRRTLALLQRRMERLEPVTTDLRVAHRDGTPRLAQLDVDVVRGADGSAWLLVIETDLSARVAREAELIKARDDARRALDEAVRGVADLSHEVRTPLGSMVGFARLLAEQLDGPVRPEDVASMRDTAEVIVSAGRSIAELLDRVLDAARLDAGKVELEHARFSVPELLRAVVAQLGLRAREKGLALRLELDPTVPSRTLGDPLRFRQVVTNLVANALKFTERGRVVVRARKRQGRLEVEVEDTGPGIAAARVASIFERFEQAEPSTARRFGGSGLGLAISRDLVARMGGTLEVESELGRGSRFYFSIPAPDAKHTSGRLPVLRHIGATPHAAHPLRILVADDQELHRRLLRTLLGRDGHSVELASDGAEAAACFRREPWDLVLVDLSMPEMDGVAATREMRAIERQRGDSTPTPIVGLSGTVVDEEVHAALEAGMHEVLAKPVDLDRLRRLLADVAADTA